MKWSKFSSVLQWLLLAMLLAGCSASASLYHPAGKNMKKRNCDCSRWANVNSFPNSSGKSFNATNFQL